MPLFVSELLGQSGLLILAGGVITTALAALAYMLAAALSDDRLRAWAKGELAELINAFFLLAMIIFSVVLIDTMLNQALPLMDPVNGVACLAQPGRPCLVVLAQNYLELIYRASRDVSQDLILQNSFASILATASISQEMLIPPWLGLSFQPLAGYSLVTDTFSTAFGLLVKVMMLQRVQQIFLDIAEQGIFPLLFVSGAVLFMISHTRRLGGLLLAIAIGVYFILPIVYAAAGYALFLNYDENGGWFQSDRQGGWFYSANPGEATLVGKFFTGYDTHADQLPYPGADQPGPLVTANLEGGEAINFPNPCGDYGETETDREMKIDSTVKWLFRWIANAGEINKFYPRDWLLGEHGYLDAVAQLFVLTVFIPFIAIMVTISCIKTLSAAFSGDTDIAGLTYLI